MILCWELVWCARQWEHRCCQWMSLLLRANISCFDCNGDNSATEIIYECPLYPCALWAIKWVVNFAWIARREDWTTYMDMNLNLNIMIASTWSLHGSSLRISQNDNIMWWLLSCSPLHALWEARRAANSTSETATWSNNDKLEDEKTSNEFSITVVGAQ